jgi:16S rRNA (guanine966-N2)-methyltransferase
VKQRIFDLLPQKLSGFSVLDLFAGTGSLGLEALSRGAEQAVFIEVSKLCANFIARNLALCRFQNRARIIAVPVMKALSRSMLEDHCFHLTLIDPPYDEGWVDRTLAKLSETKILRESSEIVVEHSSREKPLPNYGFLVLHDQRQVGQTWVSFYTRS